MESLAILTKNLEVSQENLDIYNAIERLHNESRYDININVFAHNLKNRKIFLRAPLFSLSEIYGFESFMISTSLDTFKFSISNLVAKSRSLFLSDLEWTKWGNYDYLEVKSIYKKADNVFMDSKQYAEFFENNFGIKPIVVDDFYDCVRRLIW